MNTVQEQMPVKGVRLDLPPADHKGLERGSRYWGG